MIVYQENKIVSEWPKKRTCKKCQSVLGIEKEDVGTYYLHEQREGYYPITGYRCPICQEAQTVGDECQ